jgi:hypothetical protein
MVKPMRASFLIRHKSTSKHCYKTSSPHAEKDPSQQLPLIDLEWARVYASRIQHELKLFARRLADHNAHIMNAELAKGATVLKAQMKQAGQQVGGMIKSKRSPKKTGKAR